MSGISKAQRALSWNVEVYYQELRVAGVYQLKDLLLVADVAHELELCLTIDKPVDDDAAHWQPALLPRVTGAPQLLIVLDQQDKTPFPTPLPSVPRDCYIYVFHSSSKCTGQELHSLNDDCIRSPQRTPLRRRDPRYMEINRTSNDPRYRLFLTNAGFISRAGSKKRASSSGRNVSPSPTRTEITDVDGAESQAERNFRLNLFQYCNSCVFTGEGNFCGSPGPGLEAAHVIPKSQWYTYPTDATKVKGIASPDQADEMRTAAQGAYSAEHNGLMVASHLHKILDARMVAIHPETHLIRAFVDYNMITPLHGMKATVPRLLPKAVLQQHWDMCCLENTPSTWLSPSSSVLTDAPKSQSKLRKIINDELYKEDFEPQASNTQASGTPASGTPASGTQASPPTFFQGTAHPPSPPSSEPSSGKCALWPRRESITGSEMDGQLTMEGWLFEKTNTDEEYVRGRPRTRRRCNATEEDEEDSSHEQSRDDVHGAKRQRLASPLDSTLTGL